jgi:hypothetical protein
MTKEQGKLQTALIETGREVEAIKQDHDMSDIEQAFKAFKFAIQLNDFPGVRRYGRQLAARVIKYMIVNL